MDRTVAHARTFDSFRLLSDSCSLSRSLWQVKSGTSKMKNEPKSNKPTNQTHIHRTKRNVNHINSYLFVIKYCVASILLCELNARLLHLIAFVESKKKFWALFFWLGVTTSRDAIAYKYIDSKRKKNNNSDNKKK